MQLQLPVVESAAQLKAQTERIVDMVGKARRNNPGLDLIVFPDKERTEFKESGSRTTQVNNGSTGWIYDGAQERLKDMTEVQVADFKRGIRTSLDNLLRGGWKGDADLTFVGRRPATECP